MAAEAPAKFRPLSKEDLLRRPLEHGLAIDPIDAHEIDDAIAISPQSKNGDCRIKIHVADAGLLYGTPYIAAARAIGWSLYHPDGSAELMLPREIAIDGLSLTSNHYDTDTAPAVTIAFTFNALRSQIAEVDIYKSRISCEAIDYDTFDQEIQHGTGRSKRFKRRARKVNLRAGHQGAASITQEGSEARGVVGQFMLAGNKVMAEYMTETVGIPWLFRNHHLTRLKDDRNNLVRRLYPFSDLFADYELGWYGRVSTRHQGARLRQYCHFTSPLRRFPDLVNHLNLHAHQSGLPLLFPDTELDLIALELAQKIQIEKRIGQFALEAS